MRMARLVSLVTSIFLVTLPSLSQAAEDQVLLVKGRLTSTAPLADNAPHVLTDPDGNFLVDRRMRALETVNVSEVLIGRTDRATIKVVTNLPDQPVGELYILIVGRTEPMRAEWIDSVFHGLCMSDQTASKFGIQSAVKPLRTGKERCKSK